MGGQACILYGAAEFTRDVDLAVAVSPANLERLRQSLAALETEQVFFPALSASALRQGHANSIGRAATCEATPRGEEGG